MSSIHYQGQGELYQGETWLATVSYSLVGTPPQSLRLAPSPVGTMEVIEGERNLMQLHATLTLHMTDDDLLLDVLVRTEPGIFRSQSEGAYRIDGTGVLRRSDDTSSR